VAVPLWVVVPVLLWVVVPVPLWVVVAEALWVVVPVALWVVVPVALWVVVAVALWVVVPVDVTLWVVVPVALWVVVPVDVALWVVVPVDVASGFAVQVTATSTIPDKPGALLASCPMTPPHGCMAGPKFHRAVAAASPMTTTNARCTSYPQITHNTNSTETCTHTWLRTVRDLELHTAPTAATATHLK
jgi:hypothetical protein